MPPVSSAHKRQGEAAEARFLADATAQGFVVCKPWGETAPFDFVVQAGRNWYRVQVKSVWGHPAHNRRAYAVSVGRGRRCKRAYRASEVDFVVVLVAPLGTWYLIPIRALGGRKRIAVGSDHPQSRRLFEKYRDAWPLLG